MKIENGWLKIDGSNIKVDSITQFCGTGGSIEYERETSNGSRYRDSCMRVGIMINNKNYNLYDDWGRSFDDYSYRAALQEKEDVLREIKKILNLSNYKLCN